MNEWPFNYNLLITENLIQAKNVKTLKPWLLDTLFRDTSPLKLKYSKFINIIIVNM